MKTSRIVAAILTILLSLSLIACGGEKKPENSNSVGNNELYDQVMSRFTGELEKVPLLKYWKMILPLSLAMLKS